MLRIVLAQQVLAVIVAIGRAHHRVDVVARRHVVVVDDARLVVELDKDHRVDDTVVEGARVIERADPSEMRRPQVALRLVVADTGVTLAYTPGIRPQQRLEALATLRGQFVIPDPGGVYLPVVLERTQ